MNVLLKLKFGSHLYGTNTPESDLDIKGIYLPTAREIVLGTYQRSVQIKRNKEKCERNTKDDVDQEFFSLDRFLELLTEGQTVALDMLFAPKEMRLDSSQSGQKIMEYLYLNRDKLLTKNVNAFVGYAKQQAAKYGIKGSRMDALKQTMALLETFDEDEKLSMWEVQLYDHVGFMKELITLEKTPLIEVVMLPGPDKTVLAPHLSVCGRKVPFGATVKFAKKVFGKILEGYGARATKAHLDGGVDWKALSHAVRVNREAYELLDTGEITFPRPEAEFLKRIKLGQIPYETVATEIEEGLALLYEVHATSKLRDEPDTRFVDDFVYDVYAAIVKRGESTGKE